MPHIAFVDSSDSVWVGDCMRMLRFEALLRRPMGVDLVCQTVLQLISLASRKGLDDQVADWQAGRFYAWPSKFWKPVWQCCGRNACKKAWEWKLGQAAVGGWSVWYFSWKQPMFNVTLHIPGKYANAGLFSRAFVFVSVSTQLLLFLAEKALKTGISAVSEKFQDVFGSRNSHLTQPTWHVCSAGKDRIDYG